MRPAALSLRDASAADAEPIAALFLAARRASMAYLPAVHGDAATRAWVAVDILPRTRVRVAVLDGQVVGFLSRDGDWIAHLYVAPGRQGRGIGTALLADALAAGGHARLHVFQRNTGAQRFYARHGFIVAERRDGTANEENEPDLVMAWSPPSP